MGIISFFPKNNLEGNGVGGRAYSVVCLKKGQLVDLPIRSHLDHKFSSIIKSLHFKFTDPKKTSVYGWHGSNGEQFEKKKKEIMEYKRNDGCCYVLQNYSIQGFTS